ncbi:MAG: hypothetical protein AB1491_14120 [Thermodesulfobacteriota bacterium]
MKCERCGAGLEGEEPREHLGQALCEDCYLEVLSPVRTCDPWAVHLARSHKEREGLQLTPRQQRLFDLIKEKGEIPFPLAAQLLGWDEEEMRREFATLRHLELLRATKRGDLILMTVF